MRGFHIAGLAAVALVFAASAASAASPEKEAAGWAKWVDFNQGILDANDQQSLAPLNQACKGVTGMMVAQGFQFPYWAQQSMMLCQGVGDVAKGNRKAACKTLKAVSKELAKAKPVEIEPRAEPIARQLKEIADGALSVNRC
ncbi:MAG: hypothetical protein V4466_06295 [Pseudomonadota bacterium]